MAFWWCTVHKTVEEGIGCASTSRIGPYDTRQEAETALERIHKREKNQLKKDEEYDD